MFDQQDFHGSVLGFQLKPKLLLNRREDRRTLQVVFRASPLHGLGLIRCPLSQAVSYGDDYTAATNYPIAQIQQGNNVVYARPLISPRLALRLVSKS